MHSAKENASRTCFTTAAGAEKSTTVDLAVKGTWAEKSTTVDLAVKGCMLWDISTTVERAVRDWLPCEASTTVERAVSGWKEAAERSTTVERAVKDSCLCEKSQVESLLSASGHILQQDHQREDADMCVSRVCKVELCNRT